VPDPAGTARQAPAPVGNKVLPMRRRAAAGTQAGSTTGGSCIRSLLPL
jgi:hypothetical protein